MGSTANSRRSKNPLADVEGLQAMVTLGLCYTEMARLLQKRPAEVKELLQLLGLTDEIFRVYAENRVAQSLLLQVAQLGPDRRRAAIQVRQAKTRLSGADIAEINRAGRPRHGRDWRRSRRRCQRPGFRPCPNSCPGGCGNSTSTSTATDILRRCSPCGHRLVTQPSCGACRHCWRLRRISVEAETC